MDADDVMIVNPEVWGGSRKLWVKFVTYEHVTVFQASTYRYSVFLGRRLRVHGKRMQVDHALRIEDEGSGVNEASGIPNKLKEE